MGAPIMSASGEAEQALGHRGGLTNSGGVEREALHHHALQRVEDCRTGHPQHGERGHRDRERRQLGRARNVAFIASVFEPPL
jgi:hypothetical protein